MLKARKNDKHRIKYYTAPKKSRTAFFLTSFFITLSVVCFVVAFVVVDRNSRKLGWDETSEVFNVTNTGSGVDITMMGRNIELYKSDEDSGEIVLDKLRQAAISIEPEPLQFIEIACARIEPQAEKLLDYCQNYLPPNLRVSN